MLADIKKELINHPDKLKDVLEHFGYCNIVIRPKYISFGRDEKSSKKSIVINLENNEYLYTIDYARNIRKDIFSYIIEQRKVEFIDVLNEVRHALGITDYYDFFDNKGIFGGFYEKIRKRRTNKVNTYDDSILDCYVNCGNIRFLADNISLLSQKFFKIKYDVESQGIVIPIRNQFGQLMGVKERFNYDVPDGEMKYFYAVPCSMSQTLFGYSQNYEFLVDNTIYIFEAEKSCMQCYSYGIRNCVSLGSGSISIQQVKMLLELNPKRIIFLHDVGYGLENIMRNIDMVKNYSRFTEVELGYWSYFGRGYENKVSPSDLGKECLENILQNEITMIGDEDDEDEL
jgi:DNA primase